MATRLLLAFLTALTVSVNAQQTPCSPVDDGPFLGTSPTLFMDVYEATEQELSSSPERYRAELRLHGQVGGQGANGIVLEVMPDYQFMNPEDTFRFVSRNGLNYVELYKALDRDGPTAATDDDTNVFSFTLKCSLQSNMSDFRYFDARISVLDMNDNNPEFVDLTDMLTLNELTPSGLTVLAVRAVDKDITSNLTYSLLPRTGVDGDMSSQFEINPQTGDLMIKEQLDYETMMEGTFVVAVVDGDSPSARTATALVQVSVEDGDDQGPVFVYPGCWTHRARCSWPKYTTTTVLKQGQPITVRPVPNKVQADVPIKARDLDHAGNPVTFSIASTIPPGSENLFTVSTAPAGNGEYTATITPNQDATVNHGFEIFLQAEEQSDNRRFEVAMIFFEDSNNACSSGGSASGQTGSNDDATASPKDDKYSEPVIALIVVVAILATLFLCLAIAFLCVMRKSTSASSSDVSLTRM